MAVQTEEAETGQLTPGPRLSPARMFFSKGGPGEPLGFLLSAAKEYGPVVGFRYLNRSSILLDHPDHIRHVLRANNRNYVKSKNYEPVKLVVGKGLLASEGDFWRRQRRLVQPAFHRRRIAGLASLMVAETEGMLERWTSLPYGRGEPFDVHKEMTRLTLTIVSKALFGADVEGKVGRISAAQAFLNGYVDSRIGALPRLPHWVPTPKNARYRRAMADLDGVVYSLIDERRKHSRDKGDLISMLLEARDEETGEGMGEKQLRDEVMTLLIAGNETTAVALSWAWWLLGKHPEAEAKLHGELDEVLSGRAPTFEDLPKLSYTRMLLQEAMRLYPPGWIVSRRNLKDDEIGSYRVPAGTTVLISPYVTHRNPDHWERPEVFDPERFSSERSADRPEFAYLPFGGGPRKCIGEHFAMTEGVLIMATVAKRYSLGLVPGHPVTPEPLVTLRPKRGILVILRERNRRVPC